MKELMIHDIKIKYHESMNLVKDEYRIVFLTKDFDDIHCVVDFNFENGQFKSLNIKPRFNIDITIENGIYNFGVNYVND